LTDQKILIGDIMIMIIDTSRNRVNDNNGVMIGSVTSISYDHGVLRAEGLGDGNFRYVRVGPTTTTLTIAINQTLDSYPSINPCLEIPLLNEQPIIIPTRRRIRV
jgi:hypothetical protein